MSGEQQTILTFVPATPPGAAAFTDAERQLLDAVNRRVAAQESTEAIVDFLFEQMQGVMPCDRVSIALLEDDGRRLVSRHTRAAYEPLRLGNGYAEDLAGSSLEQVFVRNDLRFIHDLQAYLSAHPNSRSTRALVKEGVRSSLTCALAVEGRRVGVLFRSSRRPRAYDTHQAHLLAAVAERLSQAVEKTWRIEQLAAATAAYTEMLGFVSHELKSPVASMMSTTQTLVDGYLGELTDEQRDALQRVLTRGRYVLDLVRDYLDLARLEGGQMRFAPRDDVSFADDVLTPAIEVVRPALDEKHMELTVDVPSTTPGLSADPDLLRIVLVNLLSNAVKYGNEAGTVRVRAVQAPDEFAVSVWNSGPGFPPEQQSRLFRKFSRLTSAVSKQARGTGVGLYTVWRIIRAHGGRVSAESAPGQWAEFRFTIPQPLPHAPGEA
ncbi:MAG: GAF domain-containing sensor histidine kinase [Phycisphaerae bacterium]|nr:GAF domain-containing sensor histidine kinase [Phycisphaerae bacterium]